MAIPNSAPHPTVRVSVGDQTADIDVKIAPLIREMWRAGITTSQLCQDSPAGWIWLESTSTLDIEAFLNIVGTYENIVGSLHDRIVHDYDRLGRPRVGQWRFGAIVHDLSVNIVDVDGNECEEYAGDPGFALFISLKFPEADLPTVLERLTQFNIQQSQSAMGTDQQKVSEIDPGILASRLSKTATNTASDVPLPT